MNFVFVSSGLPLLSYGCRSEDRAKCPQTLLSHDDTTGRISQFSFLGFIRSFNGFNLEVATDFSRTFDGTKVKIEDVQIQVTEEYIAKAPSLPQKGETWFKNMKVANIPWRSLLMSKRSQYHVKGMR